MSLKSYHVQKNPRSMSGVTLLSAEETKRDDQCCGIHGAARARRGAKHGAVTFRRRLEKDIIQRELEEFEEEKEQEEGEMILFPCTY